MIFFVILHVSCMSVYCVGPPHVEIYPGNDVSVNENGILELDCLATGRPEPTVTWMRSVSRCSRVVYFSVHFVEVTLQ